MSIRESRAPLGFCNRYVSTGAPGGAGAVPPALALSAAGDAAQALSLIDSVQFTTLHVTHIAAALDAERGLRQASIVSAHAPARVRAGQSVRVRVLVRVLRGALRQVSFTVRVPPRAAWTGHGQAHRGCRSGADEPGRPLRWPQPSERGAGGSGFRAGPAAGLGRRAAAGVAAIAPYDGLVVRFGRRSPIRVFRDPALLITGQAKLTFQVKP